jgi:RNA-binding protein
MLRGKNKAYLQSLAQKIDPTVFVGKTGVTQPVVASLDQSLAARELVKVRVQRGCPQSLDEVASTLVAATGSLLVGQLGKTITFYRPGDQPKINLPD